MTTAVASATSGVKSLRIEILPKLPGARGLPPSSPTPAPEPSGAAARVNMPLPCRQCWRRIGFGASRNGWTAQME